MRKQPMIILLLCALLANFSIYADEIAVRLQTIDKQIRIGTLSGHVDGSVLFRPDGGELVRIPDNLIRFIQFPQADDTAKLLALFDKGEYSRLGEPLQADLAPMLPYVSLPSNLTQLFYRWMVVSYWCGEYDRVLALESALRRFDDPQFNRDGRFYSGLAQMELGKMAELASFLKAPESGTVYPAGSAVRAYITARIQQAGGDYKTAIRTAAGLLADHADDADWVPRTELLCEELYFQMNMPESARSVLTCINKFYDDPEVTKKAVAIAAKYGVEKNK